MVKNQNGGNKGKKVARKDNIITNHIRYAKEEDEVYAIVTKMLGNSQCHVVCNDQITRLCIIRKKFTGKHKHSNFLKIGSWVLVGKRDWETTNNKIEKCDLLECYNENDKKKLLEQSDTNLEILVNQEKLIENNNEEEEDINIVFQEENDIVSEDEIDINDI